MNLKGVFFMSKKKTYTFEEKLKILEDFKINKLSLRKYVAKIGITTTTYYKWFYSYEKHGKEGLLPCKKKKIYTKKFKTIAVKDYLNSNLSLIEVSKKYEISDPSVLRKWINNYNNHRELKTSAKGLSNSMNKGRKTTYKERLEIVNYCIANMKNYGETAEKYNVSYQQIYSWVKKFEKGGEESLKDQRGINKKEEELTLEEKHKLELKKLNEKNRRLEAEVELLKKLKSLGRG